MKTNILTLAITLVVGIILAGSLMMPVITDASTDDKTANNLYYNRMSELGDGSVTLTYTTDDGRLFNGETPAFTKSDGTTATDLAIIADTFIIISYDGMWYYYFIDDLGAVVQVYSTATGGNGAVATIEDGTMTLTRGTTVNTVTYTKCYIPDNEGTYANCRGSTYYGLVPETTSIYYVKAARADCGVATGPVNDLTTSFHLTDGVNDTETYTFTASYDSETIGNTTLCKITTLDMYIVPLEYHYNEDNGYAALYSAIPVLVIVGLVLAATSVIIVRRD